jgi:hypothetical protein
VEYDPLTNIEVPLDQFEALREDYHIVADSNYGIGIDIVEKGIGGWLKRIFK